MGQTRPNLRLWICAAAGLCLLGLGISGYLSYKRVAGGSLSCTRWAQCDVVNNSIYAYFLGVPISFIGLAGYLLLLALALAALWATGRAQRQILWLSLLLALGGVGFSVYLTYLEIYVIEALCAWCVASAIVITLLAIVDAVAVRLHGSARAA
jgi:uncharacterized membrane protein